MTGPSTTAIHGGEERHKPLHSITNPVVFSTSFPFESNADMAAYFNDEKERGAEYIRYGHPTISVAEEKLAAIEGCEAAMLTASGMSAITTTILTLVKSGAHIVITNDSYRKTRVFVGQFLSKYGVEHTVCDPTVGAIEAACTAETKLIISESPTNPYLRCIDCEALAKFAKKRRIKTFIDATLATPFNLKPLDLGIDIVIHSATKYFGGHNDIMGGVVCGKKAFIEGLRESQGMFGALPGPMTAYLLIRGLKTFALRMRHFNESGQRVAEFLEAHPRISQVWYPGLASHPDHEVATKHMKGFGGVISFLVDGNLEQTSAFIDACQLPHLAPTFGGPESLIGQPALVSYYEMAPEDRAAIGIHDNLVRLCLGLEDIDDVIEDLDQALQAF